MAASLPVEVGDEVDADLLNELCPVLDSDLDASSTPSAGLVTAHSTDYLLRSLTYDFESGYAYRIRAVQRAQMQTSGASISGTTFAGSVKIRRASVSGTTIYDPGHTLLLSTNFMQLSSEVIVKVTNGDTSQTIVSTVNFSSSNFVNGTHTVDMENASSAQSQLSIQRVGLASVFTEATELPTS